MLQGVEVTRGDFHLGPIDLAVERGDRVAPPRGRTGPGRARFSAPCSVTSPLSSGRITLGTRVRIGVIDQQRSLFETETPVVELVRAELGDPDAGAVRTLLA